MGLFDDLSSQTPASLSDSYNKQYNGIFQSGIMNPTPHTQSKSDTYPGDPRMEETNDPEWLAKKAQWTPEGQYKKAYDDSVEGWRYIRVKSEEDMRQMLTMTGKGEAEDAKALAEYDKNHPINYDITDEDRTNAESSLRASKITGAESFQDMSQHWMMPALGILQNASTGNLPVALPQPWLNQDSSDDTNQPQGDGQLAVLSKNPSSYMFGNNSIQGYGTNPIVSQFGQTNSAPGGKYF